MNKFARFFDGISEGIRAARFSQVLNQLSDRQLVEMGLSRNDIPRRALELARSK